MHAALGLVLFPVFVAVLAWVARLSELLCQRLLTSEATQPWVLPTAVIVAIAAVAFLAAFVNQL